jgi:hypothetical protein
MLSKNLITAAAAAGVNPIQTEAIFTNVGTNSWTVPAGVTSISVVAIGGGGSGSQSTSGGCGGGGGDLRYYNNLTVTPGEVLTFVVGSSSAMNGATGIAGGFSRVSRGGTTLLEAAGGGGGTISGTGAKNGSSTAISGSVGGGNGGISTNTDTASCSGGGGTGGYSGAGGTGAALTNTGGTGAGGGGGGGGGGGSGDESGNGAGVNVFGLGPNGVGGTGSTVNGNSATGGSWGDGFIGGVPGFNSSTFVPYGTPFGNGGGGADNITEGGIGGQGVIRVVWPGTTRQFPSTNVWMSQNITTVINNQDTGSANTQIPVTALPGDLAILARAGNSNTGVQATPAGWTLITSYTPLTPVVNIWYRILQAGDAGSSVSFTSQASAFTEMTLFRKASGVITGVTINSATTAVNGGSVAYQMPNSSNTCIIFGCAATPAADMHSSNLYFSGGISGNASTIEPSAVFKSALQARFLFTRFRIYDVLPPVGSPVFIKELASPGAAVVSAISIGVI